MYTCLGADLAEYEQQHKNINEWIWERLCTSCIAIHIIKMQVRTHAFVLSIKLHQIIITSIEQLHWHRTVLPSIHFMCGNIGRTGGPDPPEKLRKYRGYSNSGPGPLNN